MTNAREETKQKVKTRRLHWVKPSHPFNNKSSESVAIGVKSQIPNMNAASRLNLRRDFKQQRGSELEHFLFIKCYATTGNHCTQKEDFRRSEAPKIILNGMLGESL
jgi:hypothetical protein